MIEGEVGCRGRQEAISVTAGQLHASAHALRNSVEQLHLDSLPVAYQAGKEVVHGPK